MDIHLHIKKQHLYLILGILTILTIGIMAIAQSTNGNVDPNKPWHPLQQVAKSATNQGSVDANANGIVDMAESVSGLTSKCQFIGEGSTKASTNKKIADVPSYCINQVCLLVMQVVKADTQPSDTLSTGVIAKMNVVFYTQILGDENDETTLNYWEAIGSANAEGNNGDAGQTTISALKVSETVVARLYDDWTGKENLPNKWTIHDASNKYGVRLFACSI